MLLVSRTSRSLLLAFSITACGSGPEGSLFGAGGHWWRGNLHTHSLWSDGDEYPEVILLWYAEHGYDFVALSDHNVLARGDRWIPVADTPGGKATFDAYVAKLGDQWVESRSGVYGLEVRLKTFSEYRDRVQAPGRFLVIESEEITDRFETKPIHVNATNLAEYIPPQGGGNVNEVIRNNVRAVLEQRRMTGVPMFPHVNHPNFGWALTVEDLMSVDEDRFFEVYNGHPLVHNEGDSLRPSTERLWDIVLADRIRRGQQLLYGMAVDDAHHYQDSRSDLANPGRAWVVVRADSLTPAQIVSSMERGRFYSSTGVTLADVLFEGSELTVRIRAEPGITYTTQFVGTRVGYDTTRIPTTLRDAPGTFRYSRDIGVVFATVEGYSASYHPVGDEMYVRAKIMSTKPKENPYRPGEVEMAWTQPILIRRR
jgi:hypothetical protein